MEKKLTIKPGQYGGFKISFDGEGIGAMPTYKQAFERCKQVASSYKVNVIYVLTKEGNIERKENI